MTESSALEARIRELEGELNLAAQLGQALVRKETKQSKLLEEAKIRIASLEQELANKSEESASSTKLRELELQISLSEKTTSRLEYELRRKDMQLQHLISTQSQRALGDCPSSPPYKEMESQLRRAELDLQSLRDQLQVRNDLEIELQSLRDEVRSLTEKLGSYTMANQPPLDGKSFRAKRLDASFGKKCDASFSKKRDASFGRNCDNSFSGFSVSTLDLDLELDFGGAAEEMCESAFSQAQVEVLEAVAENHANEEDRIEKPPEIKVKGTANVPAFTKDLDTSVLSSVSSRDLVKDSWKNGCTGYCFVQELQPCKSAKAPSWTRRFCCVSDKQLFIFPSELEANMYLHGSVKECGTALQDRLSSKPSRRSISLLRGRQSVHSSQQTMIQQMQLIQSQCKPLLVLSLDRCEVRILRRGQSEQLDARSGMMAWLKKRNNGPESDADASRPMAYKLHVVERDQLSASREAAVDDGASETRSIALSSRTGSESGTSSMDTGVKGCKSDSGIVLGFSDPIAYESWQESLCNSGGFRVDAGTLWVRCKRPGKEDAFVKRLAILRGTRLDLVEGESIKESVELSGTVIEPAYTAHIFVSHKLNNKQLVTLRAADTTERSWWLDVLQDVPEAVQAA